MRVWPAADYTRVTIESDAPLSQKHFLAENPNRLVIDVDGLELSPALRDLIGKVRADDPFIAGVRAGQNQPRVVRLVIDLKQPTAPQLFTLAPGGRLPEPAGLRSLPGPGTRPAAGPHPRPGDRRSKQAAQSVQDALGEFIGKHGSSSLRRRRRPADDFQASPPPVLARTPAPLPPLAAATPTPRLPVPQLPQTPAPLPPSRCKARSTA